jgi:hypothetical protein
MFGDKIHSVIYRIGLMGLAISLPVSVFTTSLFIIVLAANWVLEGKIKIKCQLLRERKSLWFILSIYLVFILGLIVTEDFSYAFHDVKIKLPLLLIPLVIGTSTPLKRKYLRWILFSLIAGVIAGSLASSSVLFGIVDHPYTDIREISLFVSHIRFSLLIDIAIFSLFYLIFSGEFNDPPWLTTVYIFVLIWLIVFLFLLQSITGIMIFLGVGFILFWAYLKHMRHLVMRWSLAVFCIVGSLMILSFLAKTVDRFYHVEQVHPDSVDLYTVNGNPYTHDFNNQYIENGSYIWLYVCEKEMEKEWNRISSMDYHGEDYMGQEIKYTLIRYLTSLGLRKDSAGISRLLPDDIKLIEQGKTNYIYGKKYILSTKLYEVLWQIDVYRKGGNPSAHSVTQRILYLQAALGIIKEHFWTGVGTGDVRLSYKEYYERIDSPLEERWRLRAHNQLLTFVLAYGVFGFSWIIFAFIYPVFLERKWTDYFMIMFLLVSFCSMLNEDTLETHIGVSYFAFYYALFLFGEKSE